MFDPVFGGNHLYTIIHEDLLLLCPQPGFKFVRSNRYKDREVVEIHRDPDRQIERVSSCTEGTLSPRSTFNLILMCGLAKYPEDNRNAITAFTFKRMRFVKYNDVDCIVLSKPKIN